MSAPRIESKIATDSEEFRARAAHNRALAEKLRADVAEAALGGPEKPRERHSRAASCCRATASSGCSIPARRSSRSASSPPATCTTAKCPARA